MLYAVLYYQGRWRVAKEMNKFIIVYNKLSMIDDYYEMCDSLNDHQTISINLNCLLMITCNYMFQSV